MSSNKFQSAARSYTSSNKFIEDYEKLLKKNTGSRLLFATDTNFNPAYNLTNQPVVNPMLAEGGLSSPQYSTNYQPPARREYAPLPELPEEQGEVLGDFTLPENPTAEQMLQAIFQATWTPTLPTSEELEQRYQETGQTYAVQSNQDGTVTHNDGSIHQMIDEPPLPIASMADGTVLWSDGFTREMPPEGLSSYLAGISGLSQFIFGEDQAVTQDFGNVNPGLYGSGYHQGVDYRTRDLQNRNLFAPVQMEVVQVITEDTGSPYGNSVLLRLPSGEMLRLSHLSTLGQFAEGQTLNPGDVIGMPGSTGHSTAEHLDVEYYNLDGQLDNPNNFAVNAPQYSVANQIVGTSPYQAPQTQEQPQQQNEMPAFTSPLLDTVENVAQKVVAPIQEAAQQVGKTAEQGINKWNPTGQYGLGISETLGGDPVAARQEQSQTIEKVGQQFNIPEGGVSEATQRSGLLGATRQLAGNLVDTASTQFKKFGLPDTGLSEAIAGGRTVNTDVNLAPQSFAYDEKGAPVASLAPDYAGVLKQNVQDVVGEARKAGGNLLSTAAKSVDDYADKVTAQAGQGVSQLKQGVQNIAQNIFKKPQVADVGAKRVVGEDGMQGENQSASSLLDMNKVGREQDNRDAFFKYGGADTYKDYLAPGINSGYKGALNFNLFKDSVFDSPDTVGNIFGNSYLGEEATGKYKTKEASKYPLMSFEKMGYQEGYDNGDIDRYNQEGQGQADTYNKSVGDYLGSIPKIFSGTNWQMGAPKSAKNAFSQASLAYKTPQMSTEPKPAMSVAPSISKPQMSVAPKQVMSMAPKPIKSPAPVAPQKKQPQQSRASLDDYLRMGKTKEQYYAETGQQSTLDAINREPWNHTSSQMSVGPQQGTSNAITAASQGRQYVAPSGNAIPNYTPAKANMTDASTGLPVVGRQAPYAIARMADGRTRYSDGSIR